ncbi:MAG: nucleotide exchange factor GrpE [Burkholderiaceae bacterium]|jgi:molecular chaperone GrpE|nr:nucleotide exchange factor GrpE [Burkholderiaceae bacterium]
MSHHHESHHGRPQTQPATASSAIPEPASVSPLEAAADQPDTAAQPENTGAEIEALKTQVAELTDQVLRAQAEAQNTRRRAEEEVAKSRKFAIEAFAESLLPVLDSLEAGLAVEDATAAQLREGTEAMFKQLTAALERNKVVVIAPAPGSKFDPAQQHAISMVPADQEPNTVVGVLQKGYLIADRVLRPALVTVAAAK